MKIYENFGDLSKTVHIPTSKTKIVVMRYNHVLKHVTVGHKNLIFKIKNFPFAKMFVSSKSVKNSCRSSHHTNHFDVKLNNFNEI